jgi:hypothetical protein
VESNTMRYSAASGVKMEMTLPQVGVPLALSGQQTHAAVAEHPAPSQQPLV